MMISSITHLGILGLLLLTFFDGAITYNVIKYVIQYVFDDVIRMKSRYFAVSPISSMYYY